MARLTRAIPNFINGVSQQPAALRLASQAEVQTNCYSTVAKGLTRRPPTEHVTKISSSQSADSFVHFINRDTTERYVVVYDDAHTDSSPNLLTESEANITDFVAASGASGVSTAHTVDVPNVDGDSNFYRVTFDGTAGGKITLSNFATLSADTPVTFSIWLRLVTATTLTDADNEIEISGSDLTAPAQTSINTLLTNVWTKVEVSATAISSPTGTGITIGVYCDEAVDIDVFGAQVEEAAAATLTVSPGQLKPKLKVFDFDGTEQQVWNPDGEAYLAACSDPDQDLVAITVADYTFIANKDVDVAKSSSTTASRPYEGLISFGTIQPGSTIRVKVTESGVGSTTVTQLISDTDPSELETNWAAGQIQSALAAGLGANFTSHDLTQANGSVIYLANSTNDFTVEISDGSNGLGIKSIKDKVQYFEDLPREGTEGFKVEVAGDPVTGFGNYWVEFTTDTIPVWEETVKPSIDAGLDSTTLPHTLIRNASSTFTFRQEDYDDRAVGDDDNNPLPSMVGESINDIFFTKGRLAFCSGEGVVMSEAGSFFNFFRTTVTTLIDSDPIDVASNHTKVSILRHAVPYQEQLLLFSDQTQFRLTQGDILSPAAVGIEPITEFESSIRARPAAVGNFVFFAVEKSDYASLREYFVADDSQRNDGREITGQIPEYIPQGITHIAGTSNEDVLVIKTSGSTDASELYVYKFFWQGNQKIQSSWSKWSLSDVTAILGFEFIQSTLYLVVSRGDGVFLERIEMDSGAIDDTNTGFTFHADRKVFSSDANVSGVYDASSDQTIFTFSDMTFKSVPVVMGIDGNVTYPSGYYVDIVGDPSTYDSNQIICSGDLTSEDFMFGIKYTSTYELSEIVAKDKNDVPVSEARLQLLWFALRYAYTGYFKIQVINQERATNEYEFNGRTLGSTDNPLNDVPIGIGGRFRVPLYSKSENCRIIVTSDDPLPMRLISGDWTGNLFQKFRRG